MEVTLSRATIDDRDMLSDLLELNAHHFSSFDGRRIGSDGRYGYPYLDLYWGQEPDRSAHLVHVDGALGGFVMVRGGPEHEMAEFFIMGSLRRRGVGRTVAAMVFSGFPGPWRLRCHRSNRAGMEFWSRILAGKESVTVTEGPDLVDFCWVEPG